MAALTCAAGSVVSTINAKPDRSGCFAENCLQKRIIGSKIANSPWRHNGQSNARGDHRAMPYRRGPRDRPSRAIFLAGWLSLVVGLLISFAAFVLSDDLEGPAVATVILVSATALLLEIRRRRAVWERWQSQQKRGNHPRERTGTNIRTTISEPLRPWWQVLGIPEQSTAEAVKAAYYAKIKQFHPDTVTDLRRSFRNLLNARLKRSTKPYWQASQRHRSRSPREPQENETGR